jgi:nucleotide-binding universal stress UspA family protein
VVLVGVDGTRTSLRAAAYAAGLARRQGAALVVVFVSSPALYTALADGVVAGAVQQTHDELAAELREECRRGAEELELPVTFLCRRGDAYAELSTAADETRADLVVVGSSEQAGHRLVGSVATRLVRAGRWPVVVVP